MQITEVASKVEVYCKSVFSGLKRFLIWCLITSSALINLGGLPALPVRAQQSLKPIVTVTADQPNIWTLEQAHYLLAQLRRRNLDLRTTKAKELDANAINVVNIRPLAKVRWIFKSRAFILCSTKN